MAQLGIGMTLLAVLLVLAACGTDGAAQGGGTGGAGYGRVKIGIPF